VFFPHWRERYFRDMDPIRVLIADAHALVRQRLNRSLAQEDIRVVGEAADDRQVLSGVEALQPHILLLYVWMPRLGGLVGLAKIRAKSSRTKILFLTDFFDEEFIVRALQHGAEGSVLKTALATELVKAVRTIYAGEFWAQRKLLTRVVGTLRQQLDELQVSLSWIQEVLTTREQEVVTWVVEGMTNKEIASRLGISEKTVKTHLQNIFRKLRVSRRVQLLRFRLTFPPPPAASAPQRASSR
jgi:DNA-binding NarL/FixJ family response regulator